TSRNTPSELVNRASLVLSCETLLILFTIDSNVVKMPGLELLNGSLDVLHATLFPHLLGREVAVETRAVPVTLDRLGMYRHLGTEVFRNTVENKPRHPKMITHLNTLARANLELP